MFIYFFNKSITFQVIKNYTTAFLLNYLDYTLRADVDVDYTLCVLSFCTYNACN